MGFIWFILIGALAGYVAGKLTKGSGFGLLANLVVGVIGGLIGGFLFGVLGFTTTSIIGSLITSVVGAIILLWILSFFKKRKK